MLPPLTGVAVKITLVPAQIVVVLAVMLTAGATVALTVMVIAFDVTAGCVIQVNEELITTVTTSLFANAAFW